MANKPNPNAERFDQIEVSMAALSRKVDALGEQVRAGTEGTAATLASVDVALASIKAALPSAVKTPRPLSPEEVVDILDKEPGARFRALNHVRGIKPGDVFEPRSRFSNPRDLASRISGGFKVCRAA